MSKQIPNDLMREDDYAVQVRGESPHTARNRRVQGSGPPYYKMPGRKSPVYVSRSEADAYYASFRHVPPLTAKAQEQQAKPRRRRKSRSTQAA